jgi:circadian clock protein KaiB
MSAQENPVSKKDPTGLGDTARPKYELRLFVSGALQNSVRAIRNLNLICELHLKGNYALEIIDIYQHSELAISEQIIVVPVLIIKRPLPERRLIGDLSNTKKLLEIFNIK